MPPEASTALVGGDGEATTHTSRTTRDGDKTGHSTNDDVVIAESANAYRTPTSSPKPDALNVPPRLESAQSAPPAEMEALLHPSPSQEAFADMTRANSFHGFGGGGDTQPNESQLYIDFKESIKRSRAGDATTPKRDKVLLQISPGGRVEYTYDTNATARTPRTCEEGDTGYIDVAGMVPDVPASPTAGSVSGSNGDFEELLTASPEEQAPVERDVFRKPQLQETPSMAGHKRRRSGEMVTSEPSAKKTPGYSQAFGFAAHRGEVLTGTQLFEQTQARSSPLPDGLRSDPAITRPSPNIQHNFTVSSPTVMMSSPIYNRPPPSTAGEPREKYVSLRESQERKAARLAEELGLKRNTDDALDDFEEDEDSQQRRFSAQRLRRTVSDHAVQQLGKVRTHSRPSSRPATSSSPHKPVVVDLRTPAPVRQAGDPEFDVFSDGESDEEQLVEGDEPLVEEDQAENPADDDRHSENDVYDELGQTVLRSQGAEPDDEDGEDRDEEDDDDEPPDTAKEVEAGVPQRTLVQGSSQHDRTNLQRRSQTATQHSAIADSQPLRDGRRQTSASQRGNIASPGSSYVPGSQYAGKTSQEQASLPTRRTRGAMGPPALSGSRSQEGNQEVVPSSPPLAASNSVSADNTAEASLERRKMLEQFQTGQQLAEQEIPESDFPAPDEGSSRPATAEDRPNTASNNAPFSTARSHLSANGPSLSQGALPASPLKVFASQQSKVSSQSPRTRAGVRRFADIAGPPVHPNGSGETLADVDAVMTGLLDAEDHRFLEATSSPPRPQKRRRTADVPTVASSSPAKEARVEVVEPAVAEARDAEMADARDGEDEEVRERQEDLEARALRDSPSKANERRAVSPPPESTPESVKLREQAGAKAASQLLSKRSTRVARPARLSGAGSARKAGSKLQREVSPNRGKSAQKARAKSERVSAVHTAEAAEDVAPPTDAADGPEIEETIVDTDADGKNDGENDQNDVAATVAPHRVFALFKGTYNMFYPSTWLGASPDGGHRVRFDDGTVTSIEPHLVARLELALGDQVKVDFRGMKGKVWIVKGFGPALPAEKATDALTDVQGHETVRVQTKSTRGSVSGPNAVVQGEGETVSVGIEVVYLTHTMWSHFSRREFQPGVRQPVAARLETPSAGMQTPVDRETPASRSRRATLSTAKAVEKRGSSLRDESATAVKTPAMGLFHGMAFAVSFGQNESEKVKVTRLIERNGGTILEQGFESLFIAPTLDDDGAAHTSTDTPALQLKPEHKALGFVALVADTHSRRAKYIQALALGLPTLSGRWITDSLDTAKNPALATPAATPLPWPKYLLAAGESAYLHGAVRSRDMSVYDAGDARLEVTISRRPRLLQGEGVLIVASKKGKGGWERRKAFAFLTLALGAGRVRRVGDLAGAKALLAADEAGRWAFVYVDFAVAEASAVVFGTGGGAGKKRKREEGVKVKVDAKAVVATDGRVTVVDDEFVVQSLILGALVD